MSDLVAAVAAYGAPTRLALPASQIDDELFASLLADCERHRVLGFLGAAIADGALVVTEEQRLTVDELLRGWSAHALCIERMLLRALSLLADVNIPSRVLKGVALAHTAYPQPEVRVFVDADLLVPSAHLDRAIERLSAGLDANRALPEIVPGFDRRFGKEVMLRVPENLELDVHRVFVEGAFGLTISLPDLFAPPYRFALAGYELGALPMPQRLLHACYAAALGDWPPRLVSLRDVVQLVREEKPNLVDVLLMAREWRCEMVVARAVTSAWSSLQVEDRPAIVEWAERYEPTRLDRALLKSHEGPARAFTRHIAALAVLPGITSRVAYLRAITLPQHSYLEARGMTTTGHVKRAWRRLRD